MENITTVPDGISLTITGLKVFVSGPKGKNEKDYTHIIDLSITKEGNNVKVVSTKNGRNATRDVNTVISHIANQIKGAAEGFSITMQEVHTHFPIKMEVKGGKILMHSFAGEKKPRSANIVSNVKVEVKGSNIIISGSNVEDVTQTAANVRLATHIKKLDNRIFQDGVYISEE